VRLEMGFTTVKDHVRWHLQRATWQISMAIGNGHWMSYCAGLVLTACAVFIWAQVLPMQAHVAKLESDIASAATSATPGVEETSDKSDTHDHRFLESIANLRDRTAILDGMVEAAAKHNLNLVQAQYQWLNKPAGANSLEATTAPAMAARSDASPIAEPGAGQSEPVLPQARRDQTIYALQWTLPVKGSYRDIREYVGDLLQANPSLSLESIALIRDGPTGARLQADLRFTLYLRGNP